MHVFVMSDSYYSTLTKFVERGQQAQQASLFEIAKAELQTLGIKLAYVPGEYRVNCQQGGEDTLYVTDDLADALAHGRALAAAKPSEAEQAPSPTPRKWRRPKKMTPGAVRRRRIRAHNMRIAGRAKTTTK